MSTAPSQPPLRRFDNPAQYIGQILQRLLPEKRTAAIAQAREAALHRRRFKHIVRVSAFADRVFAIQKGTEIAHRGGNQPPPLRPGNANRPTDGTDGRIQEEVFPSSDVP